MTAIFDTSFLFALTDLDERIFSIFAIAPLLLTYYAARNTIRYDQIIPL